MQKQEGKNKFGFEIKFKKEVLSFELEENETIGEVKRLLSVKTGVEEADQKLIINGKSNWEEGKALASLPLKRVVKGLLLGEEREKVRKMNKLEGEIEKERREKEKEEEERRKEEERRELELVKRMEEEREEREREERRREEERRERRRERRKEESSIPTCFFFLSKQFKVE